MEVVILIWHQILVTNLQGYVLQPEGRINNQILGVKGLQFFTLNVYMRLACDRENKIKWMQSRVAFKSQSNVSLGDQSFFIAVGEGEGEGVRILKRVIWFSGETGEISRHQQSIKGGTLDNWLPIWGGGWFQKIKESRRGSGQSYLYTTKILRTSLPPLPPSPSVINKDQ